MKHFLYILIFILSLGLVTTAHSQIQDLCDIETMSSNKEEVLTYKLYYNWGILWIPAGEVVFKTVENDDYFEYEASGRTYGTYDPVFKVRDYFYSKVDKETLRPISFKRSVLEGGYSQYYETRFDYDKNIAYTLKGKNIATAKPIQMDLKNDCVQDMLSLMYRLRALDIFAVRDGEEMTLDLFLDNEVYPMDLKFDKTVKAKKIKNLGKFDVQKLVVNLIAGDVFKDEDKMILWVSKDNNSIPLQIESPVSVGSIKAVLMSYTGLESHLGE